MNHCQPPRAVIRTPALKVPPLSCDCHAHVLGPPADYPYVADRSYTPPDASPSDYARMLGTLGLQRMVVVQASCYGEDNRRTIDAVNELGVHRARGVVMVGASITESALQAMHDAGIRATRFITTAKGGPTLDQLNDVAARVAPFGWAIEMYIPTSAWLDVLPIVEKLAVPVVFDHMGGMRRTRVMTIRCSGASSRCSKAAAAGRSSPVIARRSRARRTPTSHRWHAT